MVSAYGFAQLNLCEHSLNQMALYHTREHEKYILGIHIDNAHPHYDWAIKTAKDSQFKVRVIELTE